MVSRKALPMSLLLCPLLLACSMHLASSEVLVSHKKKDSKKSISKMHSPKPDKWCDTARSPYIHSYLYMVVIPYASYPANLARRIYLPAFADPPSSLSALHSPCPPPPLLYLVNLPSSLSTLHSPCPPPPFLYLVNLVRNNLTANNATLVRARPITRYDGITGK